MGRGGRHRDGARGALLDQSADLAAGDRPAAGGVLRARHARLEPLARARAGAAVSPGVRAVQVARLLGFRHRRAGRHGLPIMDAAYWALDLGYPTRIRAESTPLLKGDAPARSRIRHRLPAKR